MADDNENDGAVVVVSWDGRFVVPIPDYKLYPGFKNFTGRSFLTSPAGGNMTVAEKNGVLVVGVLERQMCSMRTNVER